VTDIKDLEGLPPTALGLAAQQARSAGHDTATAEAGPWLLTLDFPSYYPVLTHAKNRCGLFVMLFSQHVTSDNPS
jgi:oligopeptidase A